MCHKKSLATRASYFVDCLQGRSQRFWPPGSACNNHTYICHFSSVKYQCCNGIFRKSSGSSDPITSCRSAPDRLAS